MSIHSLAFLQEGEVNTVTWTRFGSATNCTQQNSIETDNDNRIWRIKELMLLHDAIGKAIHTTPHVLQR